MSVGLLASRRATTVAALESLRLDAQCLDGECRRDEGGDRDEVGAVKALGSAKSGRAGRAGQGWARDGS